MKKLIPITILLISFNLFSENRIDSLTAEEVEIERFTEYEYHTSEYYNSKKVYSEGLDIYSATENIFITIDSDEYEDDESTFDLKPGMHYISIGKEGYTEYERWIYIEDGERVVFTITLGRESGYLEVKANVEDFEIYINNQKASGPLKLPTGKYTLGIRSFGYIEEKREIEIEKDTVNLQEFVLDKALFSIESIKTAKKIYNPLANGGFSENILTIGVNGPSTGEIKIKDLNGNTIALYNIEFSTWITQLSMGDIVNESRLDNGLYRLIVQADNQSVSTEFIIDKNLFRKNLTIYRGFSGLILTPTAERNRKPLGVTSLGVGNSFENNTILLPISLQIMATDFLQLHSSLDFEIDAENSRRDFTLNSGLFFVTGFSGHFNTGFNINYLLKDEKNSIVINSPLSLNFRSLFFTLTPEYNYGFKGEDFYSLGYGVHWDSEKLRSGFSGRYERETLYYAVEYSFLLPETQSYLSLSLLSDHNLNISSILTLSVLY